MGPAVSLRLLAKLLSASIIVPMIVLGLGLGQGVLAQSSAKLGAPAVDSSAAAPLPDPGSLFGQTAAAGETLRFLVVGNVQGGVWGDGVYTSDSILAAAAVHAGLLEAGEAGIVSVEIVPGLSSYEGAERNGVTSLAYGAWEVAYRLVGVEPVEGPVTLSDPGNLAAYRGQDGAIFSFEVTGATAGSVWGDGVYTDDSALAAAAVHAGVLQPGETGRVDVEILPGQASYTGAESHGVISRDYGTWSGSYRVLPAIGTKVSSKLAN